MIHIRVEIKRKIKLSIVISIIVIIIAFALFTVMKYEVEGEEEVPFKIGKIIIISSATSDDANEGEQQDANNQQENGNVGEGNEGQQVENGQQTENDDQENNSPTAEDNNQEANEQPQEETENYIWNKKVIQTNDVYIYLDKNNDYEEEKLIKSVKIENIKILQNVKVGKIQVYMPNSLDNAVYKYINDFLVNSSLTYSGATADNRSNLEIGNQGGCVCLSFANVGLERYKSNDDQEIQQGATILQKMNIANDDLKFTASFDLIVEVQDMTYKTNVVLEMPVDELVGQKETHTEITQFENTIYKRF